MFSNVDKGWSMVKVGASNETAEQGKELERWLQAKMEVEMPAARGYERGFRDAVESMALALALAVKDESLIREAIQTAVDAYTNNCDEEKPNGRVLVTVSGGMADYVCDTGIEVFVFDRDAFDQDDAGTAKAPGNFVDLALPIDVPVEAEVEEQSGSERSADWNTGCMTSNEKWSERLKRELMYR